VNDKCRNELSQGQNLYIPNVPSRDYEEHIDKAHWTYNN